MKEYLKLTLDKKFNQETILEIIQQINYSTGYIDAIITELNESLRTN